MTEAATVTEAPQKPRLRGRFHQVAFFVAIPAGVALVVLARTGAARTASAVYAVSLVSLYGVSSSYHRLSLSPRVRRWMKRADHSTIYVLIAGTTTPISVLALPRPWSFVLLSIVWVGAAIGIAAKLIRIDGFVVLTGTLYIAMGWSALLFAPGFVHHMSASSLSLVVAGGLLYTGGAVVFARKRPDPVPAVFGYHEVWHSCVVAASACHYVAVLLLVLPAGSRLA